MLSNGGEGSTETRIRHTSDLLGIKSETHLSYWLLTTRPGSKTQNISPSLAVHGTRRFILWHILFAAIWFRLARMYVQLSSDTAGKEN